MTKYVWLLLVGWATLACAAEPVCESASSTLEINRCAAVELAAAKQQLQRYLQSVQQHHRDDTELIAAIAQSQEAWTAYAMSHCEAIYTLWREGSIRGLQSTSCKTRVTQERTHQLWSAYLTSMDDSPPVLPEP